MNAREIITAALRKLRVKRAGYDLSDEEAADGLTALNALVREAGGNDLLVPSRTVETLTLTAGTNPHTIGSSGTLNTTQPTDIVTAVIKDSAGVTLSTLDVTMTADEYADIANQGASGLPRRLWFERGTSLGKIYFDYVPDAAYSFMLVSLKPVTTFAALGTDNPFFSEYENFLIYNLAVDLASEYGKDPSQAVVARATQTRAAIEVNNAASRVRVLRCDPAITRASGGYNIDVIE